MKKQLAEVAKIDWANLPFDHSGRWEKKFQSIMNPTPSGRVTWPQLIAEFVVYWRSRIIKTYHKINKGEGWSTPVQAEVRKLNQQTAAICNYFPHPDDEPLVIVAVKKFFRENKPLKIGQFRKSRVTKTGKVNITQDEKDIVKGISFELSKLISQRDIFSTVFKPPTTKIVEPITFSTSPSLIQGKKMSILDIAALENKTKEINK